TWTRELEFHPHVHCIVTAGGLTADRGGWRPARQRHLFPVRVLGALFRGKVLAALQRRVARGELASADPVAMRRTLGALYHTPWLVYVKRPFGGAQRLFQYLGRYTHRVGLSNHRLVAVTPDAVTFRTKHGHTATLHPEDFLRRLLLHVLPAGFVKIRHTGLFAPTHVPPDGVASAATTERTTLFSVASSCTRCRASRRPPTSSHWASSIPSHRPLVLVERRIALPSPVEHPEPPASVCRDAFFPHKHHHPTRLRSTPVCRRLARDRRHLGRHRLRAQRRKPPLGYVNLGAS